jgi:hypothetical protein
MSRVHILGDIYGGKQFKLKAVEFQTNSVLNLLKLIIVTYNQPKNSKNVCLPQSVNPMTNKGETAY